MIFPEKITISAKMARLKFAGCGEDYIRKVCHGRCCTVGDRPTTVYMTEPEMRAVEEYSPGHIDHAWVDPNPERLDLAGTLEGKELAADKRFRVKQDQERGCTFQDHDGFCGLHLDGVKPRACTISPWRLMPNGKRHLLIISNRYKMLICYNDGPKLPAYRAFESGLVAIFGREVTDTICEHFDADGDDLTLDFPLEARKNAKFPVDGRFSVLSKSRGTKEKPAAVDPTQPLI